MKLREVNLIFTIPNNFDLENDLQVIQIKTSTTYLIYTSSSVSLREVYA